MITSEQKFFRCFYITDRDKKVTFCFWADRNGTLNLVSLRQSVSCWRSSGVWRSVAWNKGAAGRPKFRRKLPSPPQYRAVLFKTLRLWEPFPGWNTGLFEMIVGVLTTCHTRYTWDRSLCVFLFNRTTLQVFVTYLTGVRQMKHQLDATLCRFYFCRVTLHVSGASAHHQGYLKLVQRPLVYVLSL